MADSLGFEVNGVASDVCDPIARAIDRSKSLILITQVLSKEFTTQIS